MTVYNGEKFLREAIDSIINQSFEDFELIIIDDGSTDTTLRIINSYSDPRIRLIENALNRGQSYSRNLGIKESRGDYIAIMDADDIMYSNRLEKQIKFLQSGNNEICFSWADIIDEKGEWVKLKKHISDSLLIHAKLIFECPLIHPTAMWNKKAFINNNLWYDEAFVYAQDMELWNRVKEFYPLVIIEESLIKFRFGNSNSVSFQKKELQNNFAQSITKRELLKIGLNQKDLFNNNNFITRIKKTVKIHRYLTKKMGMTNDNVKGYFRDLMFSTNNLVIPYRVGKIIKKSLIH